MKAIGIGASVALAQYVISKIMQGGYISADLALTIYAFPCFLAGMYVGASK